MLRTLLCVMISAGLLSSSAAQSTPTPPPDETAAKLERLAAIPLLYQMDTPENAAIFQHGQTLGNDATAFITIGDSNTANGDFFRPFGMTPFPCDLGSYDSLQLTIDYFLRGDNSFNVGYMTVVPGLTSYALLDPLWANDPQCHANESLLACGYRVTQPAIAVIMIGLMDLEYYSVEDYRQNMQAIIEISISAGVIPIQTTYAVLPDYVSPEMPLWETSLDYNLAILDLAEQYGTPVVHLWQAQQTLPNVGIGPDRTHLKASVGDYCRFTGEQNLYGGTLRNLLSLQALDALRLFLAADTDN